MLSVRSILMKSLFPLIIVLGFMSTAHSTESPLSHVVIVWLNDGVSEGQLTDILDKAKVLSAIEVVQDVKIGLAVASARATVDDSFSFALTVEFNNSADMQTYLAHELHLEYVNSVLKPVLKKIVVYDFQ